LWLTMVRWCTIVAQGANCKLTKIALAPADA
jgi:hypothetical protein